jgi:hypothetical protein
MVPSHVSIGSPLETCREKSTYILFDKWIMKTTFHRHAIVIFSKKNPDDYFLQNKSENPVPSAKREETFN